MLFAYNGTTGKVAGAENSMGRPAPGYVRVSFVRCPLCGGSVPVQPLGRVPDSHKACAQARDDARRFLNSLAAALQATTEPAGAGKSGAQNLIKSVWAIVASEAQTLRNLYDNPKSKKTT